MRAKVGETNTGGKDPPTELLQRVTQLVQRVWSDIAPPRWTAPVLLRPPPTEWTSAEAAAGSLPLWMKRRKRGRSQESGRGTQPGGLQGQVPQPGGPLLPPRKPPRSVALHQDSIRSPRPGPGELLLLQPGQTGRERGRGTEKGNESVNALSGGAGPGVRGGAAGPGPEA